MEDEMEPIGISRAAELAGMSEVYLRKQARKKRLTAKKVGRDWITTRKYLNEWLNNPEFHKQGKRAKKD